MNTRLNTEIYDRFNEFPQNQGDDIGSMNGFATSIATDRLKGGGIMSA